MKTPIEDALRRLREESAGCEAPAALEATLVAAFRLQHRKRPDGRLWWASAAAAVLLMMGIALRWRSPEFVKAPVKHTQVAAAESPRADEAPPPVIPVVRETPKRKRPDRIDAARVQTPAQRPPRPAASQEFIQLPFTPALSPYDGGQIVRVSLPGASVRGLGFPVSSDRVQADVVIGNDGVARAIRLISNSGLNSKW